MKAKISYIILTMGIVFMLGSCELLNYDGPDAMFHGAILDSETGDTIYQDIIDGSTIDYIEQGFENPEIQKLIFRPDGTFRNNIMFSGKYKMIPTRGNFFTPDTLDITIKPGDNKYDFEVVPYARIKNVRLQVKAVGGKDYVVATFNIEQLASEPIVSIIMVMDKNPNVGRRINERFFERSINSNVDPETDQLIWLPLSYFQEGTKYYIRVGALTDRPEAKYNWNKAIRIDPHKLPKP